jgi:serine/threonine protein kinase
MAVRIRDGRLCVLKSYQGTEAQYTQVLGPSRVSHVIKTLQIWCSLILCQRCESIVTYFEYLENGPLGPTIITEHIREAQILEERLADGALNTMMVELMYGQIVDALRFLEVSDLIHRDIPPGTILSSPLGFWLTGFSACILGVATERWTENPQFGAPEVQAGGRYDSRSDTYSLCMVCNYCISPGGSSDEIKRTLTYIGDPVVGSLLTTGIGDQTDQRQFASQIHSYLENMMGQRLEIPFRSFVVVKKRHLVAMEYEGGEWIRANDLLDAAYTEGCSGEEDMASYLRQAKVINKEEYLPLRAARKFCHRYRLEAFANRFRSKTQSQVFKDAQTVYYHAPSLMYNIDQLLRVAGIEAACSCMELFPPDSRQEVQGVKAWEGTYIDNKTFKNIAKLLTNKYGITIHQRQKAPNDILASRFTCTAAKETIILVTKYFQYNMLHMRRLDGFVNWDPFSSESRYMSMADAIAKCTNLNLSELKATISDLERRSRDFQWPLPHLICEVDFDSDATLILTKSSWSLASNSDESEDELKFKFRKNTLKAIAEKKIPSVQSS